MVVKATDPDAVITSSIASALSSATPSEPASSNGSSALSGGGVAGAVVGAVAASSSFVLGVWILRRRRRERLGVANNDRPSEKEMLPSQQHVPQEIDGNLIMGTTQHRSELGAPKTRPGLHELDAP